MQIFDDFLDLDYAAQIEGLLCSSRFEWFFLNYGTCPKQMVDSFPQYAVNDRPQLAHAFYTGDTVNSSHYPVVKHMIDILERKTGTSYFPRLCRLKSNLLFQDSSFGKDDHHFPHTDDEDAVSLLYYVNDADGDTFLFDQKDINDPLTLAHRISPKRNRAVLFNSSKLHASSSPRLSKYRLVINIVFKNSQVN